MNINSDDIIEYLDLIEELSDKGYDSRTNKCGQCGSEFDVNGVPVSCAGDCEQQLELVLEPDEGDPQELEF